MVPPPPPTPQHTHTSYLEEASITPVHMLQQIQYVYGLLLQRRPRSEETYQNHYQNGHVGYMMILHMYDNIH